MLLDEEKKVLKEEDEKSRYRDHILEAIRGVVSALRSCGNLKDNGSLPILRAAIGPAMTNCEWIGGAVPASTSGAARWLKVASFISLRTLLFPGGKYST